MADKILKNLLVDLRDGLTEAVIKDVVDDLFVEKVLSKNETEDILQKNKPRSDQARGLIGSVSAKGSKASEIMFQSLEKQDKNLYDNLKITNRLEDLKREDTTSSGRHVKAEGQKSSRQVKQANENEYKMDSIPRGLCVIINNEDFEYKDKEKNRHGSKYDVVSLRDVFKFLGFVVEEHTDLSADEIKSLMIKYSHDVRHGDCFVCCVMSHGNQEGICDKKWKICPVKDITSPFDGANCSLLIGKPKVFFIQACRGDEMQKKVDVDDFGGEPDEDDDSVPDSYSISSSSDFLIVRSTVEGCYSLRSKYGSWFIQTLCKYLKDGSEQGQDILRILTDVNDSVSRKEGTATINNMEVDAKMVPEPSFTLRKTLIFRVPEGQHT